MSFLAKPTDNRRVSIKMKSINFRWLISFPLVMIGVGLLEAGRLLWGDGMHGLQMLASACREMVGASPAEVWFLLPYTADSFSQSFWLIGGGISLFVGGSGVYAIYKNREFLSILKYYCNLLAESALIFAPRWVARLLVFPIKICFALVALIIIPTHYFRERNRPAPERIEAKTICLQ